MRFAVTSEKASFYHLFQHKLRSIGQYYYLWYTAAICGRQQLSQAEILRIHGVTAILQFWVVCNSYELFGVV